MYQIYDSLHIEGKNILPDKIPSFFKFIIHCLTIAHPLQSLIAVPLKTPAQSSGSVEHPQINNTNIINFFFKIISIVFG